jgi:hypothetical protein
VLVRNLLWRKHSLVQAHINGEQRGRPVEQDKRRTCSVQAQTKGEQRGRVTAELFHGSASAPPMPSSHIFGCGPAISREISWLSLHQGLFCSPLKLEKSRDISWFGLRSPYALEPHFRMWTSNLA